MCACMYSRTFVPQKTCSENIHNSIFIIILSPSPPKLQNPKVLQCAMCKYTVVYSHIRTQYSNSENEQMTVGHENINESHNRQMEPDSKVYGLYDCIYTS